MDRRRFLGALAPATLSILAGCGAADDDGGGSTSTAADHGAGTGTSTTTTLTPSPTPFPAGPIEFPDGPKDEPEIPPTLTVDTVERFVRTYERRYVYNTLWIDEHSRVQVSCRVARSTKHGPGWKVVVGCRGSAHRGAVTVANSTATQTPVTRDYFVRYYTYLVDEETVVRRESTADEYPD